MEKVIFDTNAYRYLVTGKSTDEIEALIGEIKLKEKAKGLETLLSPIVAQELLAHIADQNDPSYEKCLKANKALYLHNGNPQHCNVFPSYEVLLSQMYFGLVPQKRVEHYNAVIQLSYHLSINADDEILSKLASNLQSIKKLVEEGEAGFIESMFEFVKAFDPNATGWQIFRNDKEKRQKLLKEIRSDVVSVNLAAGYVFISILMLKQSGHKMNINEEKMLELGAQVAKAFPEPIALFKSVLENLVNSEFNLNEKSRANYVWDIALMFSAGQNKIDNSKLYFVTSDKAIIKTAVENNSGCYVLTFNEYMEYLDT